MRHGIYYWKCDSPATLEAKRKQFSKDKYASAEFQVLARQCVEAWCGEAPQSLTGAGCDGNHFAFRVERSRGEAVFLRGDEGQGDDYMLAETAAMDLARAHGIHTPKTLYLSVGEPQAKANFQILEYFDFKPLDRYHKAGTLALPEAAGQLGALLARLHRIPLEGFGFFDTRGLHGGALRGLCANYPDYFNARLEEHLEYLGEAGLLDGAGLADIRSIFRENEGALDRREGFLIHRDPALWNILGTPHSVEAVIDWDDAVSGDPADDLGMLACFYGADLMGPLLEGYFGGREPEEGFHRRIWLHLLRNMLWKAKLRDSLGYFEKDASFFLHLPGETASLKDVTLGRLRMAVDYFKRDGRDLHGIL